MREWPVIPIPISEDVVITITNLPPNLKKEDAEKICRVVMAMSTNTIGKYLERKIEDNIEFYAGA